MLPHQFLMVLLIFSFSHEALTIEFGMYTIVAPGTVRSDSVLDVSISLSNFSKHCSFNVSLKSQSGDSFVSQLVDVEPNTVKLIELRVTSLYGKRGELEIIGYQGIHSNESAEIIFEYDSYSVFVQTNKAKFKPGELVEFRVICIDQLTRPAKLSQNVSVLIYDSQDYLIKQIANVKLVQGVFKGDFQISDSPVLGEWKIKVKVGGDAAAEKNFQVAKYVLPKFSVQISTKTNVAITENQIALVISANYFYGEPVKGNLTLQLNNTYAAALNKTLPTIVRRHSQINEKISLIFDLENDLNIENEVKYSGSLILFKFDVIAIVADIMTEQQSKTETEIVIHSQPYKIKLQAPKVFHPDEYLKFLVKVSVTDLEDKIIKDTVQIMVECNSGSDFNNLGYAPVQNKFTHQIGKDFLIELENRDFSVCNLYADYKGFRSRTERSVKNENTFYLDVLTESPEVDKELEIELKSLDKIGNFSYEIVSRGLIVHSAHVHVPENQSTHIFRFNVTHAMVPKITIYAHRVRNRVFNGQLKEIYIKRAFQNSIQIATDIEAKPGSLVNISVTTNEGSYVGLMGLDYRILQSTNNEADDLTEDHFYTKLRNFDASSIDKSLFPGKMAGLLTFSNAPIVIDTRFQDVDDLINQIFEKKGEGKKESDEESFDKPTLEFPRIRKLFSESWLYKDVERTPEGGFNLLETTPDSITSWAITGFSLNPTTGLTLTKNATTLKVFQEFFVSIDIPNLVKEGETIEVPIYIRNYMMKAAMTSVTIEKDSANIEILKYSGTVLKPKEPISKLVPANEIAKIVVFMKPLKSRTFNITVKAVSPIASDAVQKTLSVKSEGIPYEISKTYLVHLPEEGIEEEEIMVDIPQDAVPGSQTVEISVVGDVFRPLLSSLQKNLRAQYGNGEDNMRFIVTNLLVLKYFKALDQKNSSLEREIKFNLQQGYQNQRCFNHLDGSFGLFGRGENERSGDIWQTAFALWGLKQSNEFIDIELKVFERGLDYLHKRQDENGCFRSRNGGIQNDIEFTAFSVMVFLMDIQWQANYTGVISKGLSYLYEKLSDNFEQTSTSVLSTYVLLMGKHAKAEESLQRLTSTMASFTRKPKFWNNSDTLESHLETTADYLLNLFESRNTKTNQSKNLPIQRLLQIIRGLIVSKTDEKLSLTHIVALRSMIVFVKDLNLSSTNLGISFKNDQKESGAFRVNFENLQLLQTMKLAGSSQRINLQSKGYGFAVVEVKSKYNLVTESQSLSSTYVANITILNSLSSLFVFEVCASVVGINITKHLTVMEVSLQSGYIFSERATPAIGLTWKFKSIKVKPSQDRVEVYIENLNDKGNCLILEALKNYNVLNAKPGWVVLYDVHKRDEKSVKSFKINKS